jgi:glycosyltransferase involved in cell wall biosynthesis
MPAVSVVMTSYNHAAYLGEAVASVRAQTWTDWELLVIDDGSGDNSLALAETFARQDCRIRVLRHPDGGNHGLPASLGRGLAAAAAPLVAFLESDDAWRPDCLEKRLRAFSRLEADVVFNNAEPVLMGAGDGRRMRRYLDNLRLRFPRSGSIDPLPGLWLGNVVPSFSCAMLRRTRLLECGLDAPEPAWLDWWIWLQLSGRARFVWLDEPLTRWRIHGASYSASLSGVAARNKRLLRGWLARPGVGAPLPVRLALALPGPGLGLLRGLWLLWLRLRRHGREIAGTGAAFPRRSRADAGRNKPGA